MNDDQDGLRNEPEPLKLILLVVDGSESSDEAAKYAIRLAVQTGMEILAVYAIDTATMDYLLQMHILVSAEREDFESALELKGESYLQYTERLARKAGARIETRIVRGRFHEEIARIAVENHADMAVMGSWRRLARGKDSSAAERELLLDRIDCPLLVVKPPRK